jgi:hypothetical protein
MKKLFLIFFLSGLSSLAHAENNKYEFALDLGLYSLYTNHGQENTNGYYGDASNSGTKLNPSFSILNNLDSDSAVKFSVNILDTNPRKATYTVDDVPVTYQKKFKSTFVDLDYINKYQIGKSSLGLLAGIRYADTQWNSRYGANYNQPNEFKGFGPSLGLLFNRSFTEKISIMADAKYSHLFGKTTAQSATSRSGSTSAMFESQIGFEYKQKLEGNRNIVYGLGYKYVNFLRLSNLVQHIDPEDTDYTVAGPRFTVRYTFN